MRGGGEEGVERRRERLSHTHGTRWPGKQPQLQPGSRALSPPLGAGGPGERPRVPVSGAKSGPALWGVAGRRRATSRAAVRGCRRAEGNGARLRSSARACPSPGGRGAVLHRGQGQEGSSAPFSGPPLPANGLLFAG